MAQEAGVKTLVLSHFVPPDDSGGDRRNVARSGATALSWDRNRGRRSSRGVVTVTPPPPAPSCGIVPNTALAFSLSDVACALRLQHRPQLHPGETLVEPGIGAHAVPLRRDREMDQRRIAHVEGALEKLEGLIEISHLGVAYRFSKLTVATLS